MPRLRISLANADNETRFKYLRDHMHDVLDDAYAYCRKKYPGTKSTQKPATADYEMFVARGHVKFIVDSWRDTARRKWGSDFATNIKRDGVEYVERLDGTMMVRETIDGTATKYYL